MQEQQVAAQQADSGTMHSGSTSPYQAGFAQRWPDMLGSLPYREGLPTVSLKNGRTCPIIASCATGCDAAPGMSPARPGYIACLSLVTPTCLPRTSLL